MGGEGMLNTSNQISVYPGITPLIYSWSAANTAGETKKKVGARHVSQTQDLTHVRR